MAMAASTLSFSPSYSPRIEVKADKPRRLNFAIQAKGMATDSQNDGGSRRRIWRRRKLTKKDYTLRYAFEREPFFEEMAWKMRENGGLDIDRLLLSEDNRFDFVNEMAAEAKEYVEKNRDEYGAKKAILHVLSDRMNDAGFYRNEAYQYDPLTDTT